MRLDIQSHDCLTPDSSEKSIYYLTLSVPDSGSDTIDYAPGDWVTIQACNRPELVSKLLAELQLSGQEIIELRRAGQVTVEEALRHHLEITQLNPAILNKIQRQMQIGSWQDRQQMMDFAYGKDILDLLEHFPELKNLGVEFLTLLSPLAPRYYSIASANLDHKTLSILYRQVNYHHNERERFGVASNFLVGQGCDGQLEVEIKPNPTFKMPQDSTTPIIMMGAGTGLAPFVGFMQQREQLMKQGKELGAAYLFYGETSQLEHCLLCDWFEAWQAQGLVENVYAFSRDQAEKVYVQHRLLERAETLWALIGSGAHLYICGSQNRLAVAVKEAMLTVFQQQGGLSAEDAEQLWNQLRKEKRLQQDVY